ncbi:MAG: hypothetical protein IJK93_10505 [Muribaculaceae bacterium]|nr:hypothetical protein [Muribaculaceae bacterium]
MKKTLFILALTAFASCLIAQANQAVGIPEQYTTGKWVVVLDKNNNEVWKELTQYSIPEVYITDILADTTFADYDPWDEVLPKISFHFAIDGTFYGPEDNMTEVVLGDHVDNPMFQNDNYYICDVDFDYFFGIYLNEEIDTIYALALRGSGGIDRIETPTIDYEINDETVQIYASGKGSIRLFVNGERVDNPYSIARGTEDVEYVITAAARPYFHTGMESETATLTLIVPAKEDHSTGYWMECLDEQGNSSWYELKETEANPGITIHGVVIANDSEEQESTIYFRYLIDGVMYGAETNQLEAMFGEYEMNPLFECDNYYCIPSNRLITMGVYTEDGLMYAYAAIGDATQRSAPPVISYTINNTDVTITATSSEPFTHICLYVDGEQVSNPCNIEREYEDKTVTITATAEERSKLISETVSLVITIPRLTSVVDEISATNKSIASTRYYNTSGQEIQVPNGMTLVVTTYSDGSTTTTKIAK